MIIELISVFFIIASIIAVGLVCKAKLFQEKLVREEYAFKCLAAIVSLTGLAIGCISSKEGIVD